MTSSYVTSFEESNCQQVELVGGKFQSLARLAQLGVAVPRAFCLTTDAYRAFVSANSLRKVVSASLAAFDRAQPAACREATSAIRKAFLAAAMPPELAARIENAYGQLGSGAVAVRSSATAEDLPTSSAAGGHDTFLNIHSRVSLEEAIRSCWASLWTERAILYRRRFEIPDEDAALAVVVQKMVAAQVSGVVFTAEPATGNHDILVVEACRGLAQALVSGEVTPDHFEMDRRNNALKCRPGLQTEMVTARQDGGVQKVSVPVSLRGRLCLERAQLQMLAEVSLVIERHFGAPQDIEWAIGHELGNGSEKLYILQARPITSLKRQPACATRSEFCWKSPISGAVWVRDGGGLSEYLPSPVSPLYATAQLPAICRLVDAREHQMGTMTLRPPYALINGYYYSRQDYRIKLSGLLLPLRYWHHARTKVRWWREQALPTQFAELKLLSSFDTSSAADEELVHHLEKLFAFNANAWDAAVWASKNSQFTEPLVRKIFERFIRPIIGGDIVVFLRGFESQTLAGERALWGLMRNALSCSEIASCVRENEPVVALEQLSRQPSARGWLQDFLTYCRTYGHASTGHDYLHATAADDPAKAMANIKIRLNLPASDPDERHDQLLAERLKATRTAMTGLSLYPIRRALFRWALDWAQEGAAIRENVFFYAFQGWPLARRTILALGNRLARAGRLSSPEDIFFLTWDEAKSACKHHSTEDLRATVAKQRQTHQEQTLAVPPHWVPQEGPPRILQRKLKDKVKRFLLGTFKNSAGILRGAPVSPGIVTGPARIIRSTADFGKLQAGDIMVAPTATPEWMPTFAVAAGLVTDVGGPLSHSSIIVREFGIPAVMGARKATSLITDGQMITLDGSQGLIQLYPNFG
jgi:phosphohistidine swiveling domain-containing protein